MENAEQHESQNNEKIEQSEPSNDSNGIEEQIASLKSTNDRLLAQSKDNADKYRKLRDKTDAKEKLELEESESWKQLLDKEKNDHHELRENYASLKKTTLKKDLNFNIAKLIGSTPLNNGVNLEHVIDEVLRTGMVEVSEDESEFLNVNEAFEKVKLEAVFLFDSKKVPMANAIPGSGAPKERQLTKDELFRKAIQTVHGK